MYTVYMVILTTAGPSAGMQSVLFLFPGIRDFLWFNYDAGNNFQSESSEAWLPSISDPMYGEIKNPSLLFLLHEATKNWVVPYHQDLISL